MSCYFAVFRRMAWAAGWASAGAGVAAGVLVCGEGFLFPLSLYLGARDLAALPIRPTDVLWLEVSVAFGDCESGGDRSCGGLVTVASTQYRVASECLGSIHNSVLGTLY